MDDRTRALNEIAAIAGQHGLSASDIAAAIGAAQGPTREQRRRGMLVRVLGFLGGIFIFIFAGSGAFIALQWDQLNSAARVVVTLGSGLAAFGLAVVSNTDPRFDKAATPLFLMAAALEPTGMLVVFDEFGSGGDWRYASLMTAGSMAIQFGATFGLLRRSTLLFMSILFGTLFWWTAFDLIDMDDEFIGLILGASLLLTAVGVDRTRHRDITPVWYLFGAAAFLYGVFDVVDRTPFEIIFLVAAAGFVYLSAFLHSRSLLFVAMLAILAYTAWFTGQHLADSAVWPLALIAFGIFIIGLSALAFRIDRNYVRSTGDH